MTTRTLRETEVAKREAGFTLIELLVVIAIIGIIIAIATPGLKRARQQAHSGSATQSTRTIITAEYTHENRVKTYTPLATLHAEGLIPNDLADFRKVWRHVHAHARSERQERRVDGYAYGRSDSA